MCVPIAIASAVVLPIMIIVLVCVSFTIVDYNSMGIFIDYKTLTIDQSTLYHYGYHFTGIGTGLLQVSKLVQTYDFVDTNGPIVQKATPFNGMQFGALTLHCQDGVEVDINASFQWKFKQNATIIYNYYMLYNMDFKSVNIIQMMAIDALLDVATQFTVFDFHQNRALIDQAMFTSLQTSLSPYADLVSFDILSVVLPSVIQNAVQTTVDAEQSLQQTVFDNQAASESAETIKQKAVLDATVIRLQAEAQANITLTTALAAAKLIEYNIGAEAAGYANFTSSFQTSNGGKNFSPTDFLTYLWVQTMVGTDVNSNVELSLDLSGHISHFDYTGATVQ